jgi:hypothetical protein
MFAGHIIKSPYKCPMLKSGIYTGRGRKLLLTKNVYETLGFVNLALKAYIHL